MGKKTQSFKNRRITENGDRSPENFDLEVRIPDLKKAVIPVLKFPCSEKSSIRPGMKFYKIPKISKNPQSRNK